MQICKTKIYHVFGKPCFTQLKKQLKVSPKTLIYVCMNEYVYFQIVCNIFIVFRQNPLRSLAFVIHNVYFQIVRTHHGVQHYVKRVINALLDFSVTAGLWQPKLDCHINELGATSRNWLWYIDSGCGFRILAVVDRSWLR